MFVSKESGVIPFRSAVPILAVVITLYVESTSCLLSLEGLGTNSDLFSDCLLCCLLLRQKQVTSKVSREERAAATTQVVPTMMPTSVPPREQLGLSPVPEPPVKSFPNFPSNLLSRVGFSVTATLTPPSVL